MQNRKTVFITGANRGIGLGLAGQYLAKGHHVVAAARNPDGARDLWELERDFPGRCRIVELDVTRDADLKRVVQDLKSEPIDVLINNAGVSVASGVPLPDVTSDDLLKAFTVNTLGPIRVTQALLGSLQAAAQPVVATISSKMGSIADNSGGGSYAYRISKAAVNMFQKSFAADYTDITAVVLHPGWVKTDMGGAAAPVSILESVQGLFRVIEELKPKDSGRFLDFRGQEIPW